MSPDPRRKTPAGSFLSIANRFDESFEGPILAQIDVGAGIEHGPGHVVFLVHREPNNTDARKQFPHPSCCLNPIHLRHGNVHNDDVWP